MSQRGGWLGVLLLLVLFGAGGRALWLWLDRPLERVSIGGDLEHVSADYLRDRLSPLLRGHTWLSVNVSELREQALAVDWIAEARVSREWPNALTLELVEQVPVARWNDDSLLNSRGEPFAIGSVSPPGGLPDLAGPEGSGAEVLAYHERLATRFAEMGLELTQLRLEPRGAWRFQLNDGVWVMLGRGDREGRLARLTAAWRRQLERQASHIRYIDLRYPNGVAVAWHGEVDPLGQDGTDEG
ncbi:cell division protein FtsQ/DivIB [uncultured Halomonas sp.]|uniref:cell division protein FtsQ/DivIB n=1 Tax=uncultured Halomonas sp. TaxID=173971 RepID=UPI002638F4C0|nr:cell division protein FtsQ/DivIB [uncultured Halomonas sp.]